MDPAERDARLVNRALGGDRRVMGVGDHHACWALVEVACASAPDHLIAVRRAYRSLFGCSLEEDVAACPALQDPLRKVTNTSRLSCQCLPAVARAHRPFSKLFRFLQLLVSLVRSYRCGTERVDEDVARLEAAQLAEAIRKRRQPHGDEVARIVSTRSKHQLRATFKLYKQDHGTDVDEVPSIANSRRVLLPSDEKKNNCMLNRGLLVALLCQDITKHSSSQFAKILRSAVWCLTSPEKHFAEVNLGCKDCQP
jgi:annexin A7/11